MNTLYIDLETRSPTPIKHGVYRYAEKTEILLVAWALGDGPVQVEDLINTGCVSPEFVVAIDKADCYCAHNSQFDRVIIGDMFPKKPWRDTRIRGYAHGLPGGLGELCDIYKLPTDKTKDKEGKALIRLFCIPRKDGTWATKQTHPEHWAKFVEYARLDIEAMRELDKRLPAWNDSSDERALWALDQKINDRGFLCDVELAKAAIEAVQKEQAENDRKTHKLTDGAVSAATQRDALLRHMLDIYEVKLPNMRASTLERRLNDPDLPEPVRELIALRLASSGTSTTKYATLLNAVSSDNRLRGTLQFCGANRTGRWSGKIFQPQNLPRPMHKARDVEIGIEALKAGAADLIYDNVTDLAASAIRGVILAPPGKKLVVADLSSIEGRVLAWLAGEEWKLDAYRDYDLGIGHDMYVLTYARTFNVKPESVDKSQRQLGKVLELALGYGGGVGAFITFANGYGIDLAEMADRLDGALPQYVLDAAKRFYEKCAEEKKTHGLTEKVFVACDAVKRLWREANAMIESFWYTLEKTVRDSIEVGFATRRETYAVDKKGSWLRVRLPSGRYLCYAGARIKDGKIEYLGVNQYSRKFGHLSTYGGKLAENLTQAASRDILAHGMTLAEQAGYEIVLSVHDELITEAPDKPEYNAKYLSSIMSTVPGWAKGLPLAAAGFESYRYRKD